MGYIHPAVSEIWVPQSLDPICAKFDKFLAHGQAHMGQMGKWPWQCTTTGLDNSTELWMENICQGVTEIWVPQVWQLSPDRPPVRTVTTIPLQPWGVKITNYGLQTHLPGTNELKLTHWPMGDTAVIWNQQFFNTTLPEPMWTQIPVAIWRH